MGTPQVGVDPPGVDPPGVADAAGQRPVERYWLMPEHNPHGWEPFHREMVPRLRFVAADRLKRWGRGPDDWDPDVEEAVSEAVARLFKSVTHNGPLNFSTRAAALAYCRVVVGRVIGDNRAKGTEFQQLAVEPEAKPETPVDDLLAHLPPDMVEEREVVRLLQELGTKKAVRKRLNLSRAELNKLIVRIRAVLSKVYRP